MFENFHGNAPVARSLEQMILRNRIPQTLLLAGPEGVGKATLARRFAARLLGNPEAVERDDLSLEPNQATIGEREKWPSKRRVEDPLLFSSHPDFITFPPDGPLRQISYPAASYPGAGAQMMDADPYWFTVLTLSDPPPGSGS